MASAAIVRRSSVVRACLRRPKASVETRFTYFPLFSERMLRVCLWPSDRRQSEAEASPQQPLSSIERAVVRRKDERFRPEGV